MHIHELQSHFIPHILKLVEDQFVDANALTDIDFWKRFMKNNNMEVDFSWDDISVDCQPLDEMITLIFYSFPMPYVVSEARYGLIFINLYNPKFHYYLLEMASEDKWILSELATDESRKEHGYFEVEPTAAEFVNKIFELEK